MPAPQPACGGAKRNCCVLEENAYKTFRLYRHWGAYHRPAGLARFNRSCKRATCITATDFARRKVTDVTRVARSRDLAELC